MTSKKAESEEIHLKSKMPCIRCSKTTKANTFCCKCKETICLAHSTLMPSSPSERICDDCLEDHLLTELPDKEIAIEAIRNEIQNVINTREENTKKLCKLSATFLRQKEDMIAKEEKHAQQAEDLNAKLTTNRKILQEIEEDIENKEKIVEKNTKEIENARMKLLELQPALEKKEEEVKKLKGERNQTLAELTEIREFLKMQVPIRLVKRIVCSNCYPRVQAEYYKLFKPESGNVEIRTKSELFPAKKTGACNSCCLF